MKYVWQSNSIIIARVFTLRILSCSCWYGWNLHARARCMRKPTHCQPMKHSIKNAHYNTIHSIVTTEECVWRRYENVRLEACRGWLAHISIAVGVAFWLPSAEVASFWGQSHLRALVYRICQNNVCRKEPVVSKSSFITKMLQQLQNNTSHFK